MAFEPTENEIYYTTNNIEQARSRIDNNIIDGAYDIKRTVRVKEGKVLTAVFNGKNNPPDDALLFIEVNGKRFYAPLNKIFYFTGSKITYLSEKQELSSIPMSNLIYVEDNGKQSVISAVCDSKTYQIDVKTDPNCSVERMEGLNQSQPVVKTYVYNRKKDKLGARLLKERENLRYTQDSVCRKFKDAYKVKISVERLDAIEKGTEQLTAEEEKAFLTEYKLTPEFFNEFMLQASDDQSMHKPLSTTISVERVEKHTGATINVRYTDNVETTVKLDDIYLAKEAEDKYTKGKSLEQILADHDTKFLLGKKIVLKRGDLFVPLQDLTKDDFKTISEEETVVKLSSYNFTKNGEYVKITLASSGSEKLVKITDLTYNDKKIESAKELQNLCGEVLIYDGNKTLPLTAEQALITYSDADVHFEEVDSRYAEDLDQDRYLLTKDGDFVEEECVRPICYDKATDADNCDAYLLVKNDGTNVVVLKNDFKSSVEHYKEQYPLKVSKRELINADVIQTSNSALDGVEHSCVVLSDFTDDTLKEEELNKAKAEFLTLYKNNLYEVNLIIPKVRPISYEKTADLSSADAYMIAEKGKQLVVGIEFFNTLPESERKKAIALKYSKKPLNEVDVILTSHKAGELKHECLVVSAFEKGAERENAINKATEEVKSLHAKGEYDTTICCYDEKNKTKLVETLEPIELDPRNKRYVKVADTTLKNVSAGDAEFIKEGVVTIKDGKITGGPKFEVGKKADKFTSSSFDLVKVMLTLCLNPVGFLFSPILSGAALVAGLTGIVGNVAIRVAPGIRSKIYGNKIYAQRKELKAKNAKEIEDILSNMKHSSNKQEQKSYIKALEAKLDNMIKSSEILSEVQTGSGIEVKDGKCKVNATNANVFAKYEKEYNAKQKQLKKLERSKKPEDQLKREKLTAEIKTMQTDYKMSQTVEADPKATEYKGFMAEVKKFVLYKASLDPDNAEDKKVLAILDKCKIDYKSMIITYKGKDISKNSEVENVVENISAHIPEKAQEIDSSTVNKEVFDEKVTTIAKDLKINEKGKVVSKKASVTKGYEHGAEPLDKDEGIHV